MLRTLRRLLARLLPAQPVPVAPTPPLASGQLPPQSRRRQSLTHEFIAGVVRAVRLGQKRHDEQVQASPGFGNPWQVAGLHAFRAGVVPDGVLPQIATDDAIGNVYATLNAAWRSDGTPVQWLGFPFLAELATRPEYRRISEGIAREMTRKWGRFSTKGEADKAARIKVLDAAFTRLRVRDLFKWAMETDGYFGRAQLHIDVGQTLDHDEMRTPLSRNRQKIPMGAIKRLVPVEPMWSYPGRYNAINPLLPDFYQPTTWWVQSTEVHHTRLLTFISRPVADILKPAYAFSGLSLSQLSLPAINNWLRARQSVSDLIHSFSVPVLKTSLMPHLGDSIDGEDSELAKRITLFNALRDNRATMVLDKDMEDFSNVSTPLGSLDKLQAQAVEQIAFVPAMPLVVMLGTSPAGLNPSADGEIQVWHELIRALQESVFDPQIQVLMEAVMLSEFGEIDPDIGWVWNPLKDMDETQLATIRKTNAETFAIYVDSGVLAPEEERSRLASDEEGLYSNINPDDVPEPPEQDDGLGGMLPDLAGNTTPPTTPDDAPIEGAPKSSGEQDVDDVIRRPPVEIIAHDDAPGGDSVSSAFIIAKPEEDAGLAPDDMSMSADIQARIDAIMADEALTLEQKLAAILAPLTENPAADIVAAIEKAKADIEARIVAAAAQAAAIVVEPAGNEVDAG